MNKKRIAVARLWFEGNSFCPRLTTMTDFYAREWHDAATAPDFYRHSQTEMGGVVDWIEANADQVQVRILRCAAAPPGGPLAAGVFSQIADEIVTRLKALQQAEGCDGVYLSLHGAMVAEDAANADFELIARVRAAMGAACPVAVSFDLHANLDPAIAERVDIIVGYKTYPHIDMAQTAIKALDLLLGTINQEIQPVCAITTAKMILPSHLMATDHAPMSEIENRAQQWMLSGAVLDATPFGGFAYADTAVTSASASICIDAFKENRCVTDATATARRLGQELVHEIRSRKSAFMPTLPDAQQGLQQALAALSTQKGCVALLDPADNPLSGGIGDTPTLFRELMESAVTLPTVFAFFHDPDLVRRAQELGIGAGIVADLGGRVSKRYGQPVSFQGKIELLTDGQFVNEGPMEKGLSCNIGPSVVLRSVRHPHLRVVISSECQSPNDMAWCRLHQIDLATTRLFCVKAKNHFRAAFKPHLLQIIDIDTPGPAMLDLTQMPYQRVNRHYLAS